MARQLYLAVVLPTVLFTFSNAAPFRPGGRAGWGGSLPQPQDVEPQQGIQPQLGEELLDLQPQGIQEVPDLEHEVIQEVPDFEEPQDIEPQDVQPQDIRPDEPEFQPQHHFKRHAEPQPWAGDRPPAIDQQGDADLVPNETSARMSRNPQSPDDDAIIPNEFSARPPRHARPRTGIELVQNERSARLINSEAAESGFEGDDEADTRDIQIGRFTVRQRLPGPARDSLSDMEE